MADLRSKIRSFWVGLFLLAVLCAGAEAVNHPPVLAPIGTKEVLVGETLSFTLSATDPDDDRIFFSGADLPIDSHLNPETGQFVWSPAINQIGTYSFTFSASDDGFPTLSSIEIIPVKVIYRLVRHKKAWGFGVKEAESVIETSELSDLFPKISKLEIDGHSLSPTQTLFNTSEDPKIRIELSSPYNVDTESVMVLLDGEQIRTSPFSDIQTFGEQKNILSFSFEIEPKKLSAGTHSLSIKGSNDLGVSVQNITLNVGKLRIVDNPLAFPVPFSPGAGRELTLQYSLSRNADIEIFVFSSAGQAVKKLSFSKGEEGGKEGLNKVSWDGISNTGTRIGNGIYVATIIDREVRDVLGKIKLVVY
jgi:hypothetical protein